MKIEWVASETRLPSLGYIPLYLSLNDPRSAKEQINAKYPGGWHSMDGFDLKVLPNAIRLIYPGDPSISPVAFCHFRDEFIIVFEHAWVVIMQKNGEWEVSRMD